jgi:hypothetical protein
MYDEMTAHAQCQVLTGCPPLLVSDGLQFLNMGEAQNASNHLCTRETLGGARGGKAAIAQLAQRIYI